MMTIASATRGLAAVLTACFALVSLPAPAAVSVNGVTLDSQTRGALTSAYGPLPDGAYWYDSRSGLWGTEGGPTSGQIMPGLVLGGTLRPDASGGGQGTQTGVFINGREIHPQEYQSLAQLFGYVSPGRYWLGPDLTGGYEGGPAQFSLRQQAGGRAGGAGYNRRTYGGDLMSDGQCSGYLHPGGATVMTGNC